MKGWGHIVSYILRAPCRGLPGCRTCRQAWLIVVWCFSFTIIYIYIIGRNQINIWKIKHSCGRKLKVMERLIRWTLSYPNKFSQGQMKVSDNVEGMFMSDPSRQRLKMSHTPKLHYKWCSRITCVCCSIPYHVCVYNVLASICKRQVLFNMKINMEYSRVKFQYSSNIFLTHCLLLILWFTWKHNTLIGDILQLHFFSAPMRAWKNYLEVVFPAATSQAYTWQQHRLEKW